MKIGEERWNIMATVSGGFSPHESEACSLAFRLKGKDGKEFGEDKIEVKEEFEGEFEGAPESEAENGLGVGGKLGWHVSLQRGNKSEM